MSKLGINKKLLALCTAATLVLSTGCAADNAYGNKKVENPKETNLEEETVENAANVEEKTIGSHKHVHVYDGDTVLVFRECDGLTISYSFYSTSSKRANDVYIYDGEELLFRFVGDTDNHEYIKVNDESEDFIQEIEGQPNYKVYKKSK